MTLKKILILLQVSIFLLTFISCNEKRIKYTGEKENVISSQTGDSQTLTTMAKSTGDNEVSKIIYGDLKDIILKTGSISEPIAPVCIKDSESFFVLQANETKLFSYNFIDGKHSLIQTVISPRNLFWKVHYSKGWIVWCELESKYGVVPTGDNWTLYAKNLNSKEIIKIDSYNKNIKLDESVVTKFGGGIWDFSLSEDKLTYTCYDVQDNETYQMIKFYDLSNKNLEVIHKMKDNKFSTFGVPCISEGNIVWSESTFKQKSNTSENGKILMYNIKTKQTNIISSGDELLHPIIHNSVIAAIKKPNGENTNSELLVYDSKHADLGWKSIVSSRIDTYNNLGPLNIFGYQLSGDYLKWDNNLKNDTIDIYRLSDHKFYRIDSSKNEECVFVVYTMENNVIVWGEVINDKIKVKYAILK